MIVVFSSLDYRVHVTFEIKLLGFGVNLGGLDCCCNLAHPLTDYSCTGDEHPPEDCCMRSLATFGR